MLFLFFETAKYKLSWSLGKNLKVKPKKSAMPAELIRKKSPDTANGIGKGLNLLTHPGIANVCKKFRIFKLIFHECFSHNKIRNNNLLVIK